MEKWFTIFRNLHDEIPNKVTEDEKKTKTKDKDTFSDLNNLKEPDNSNPISNIPEPDQMMMANPFFLTCQKQVNKIL